MRLSKMIDKVRQTINPPYSTKDYIAIFGTLFILLAIPLTVWTVNKIREPKSRASTPVVADISDEIILKFKPGADLNTASDFLSKNNLSVKSEIKELGVKLLKVPAVSRDSLIAALSRRKEVDYATKNYIVSVAHTPNDPYFTGGFQWNLTKIQAPSAWDLTIGSTSVPVAVLDTGIDSSHPDWQDKIIAKANFSASSTVEDVNGHGTHVGGIAGVATNNSIGVAGLGYIAPVLNVKTFGDSGTGSMFSIGYGITWAVDNGAKVINISGGAPFQDSSGILPDAINYAWNKGVVIVSAAGNDGNTTPYYPAAYPNVIAVAATDIFDRLLGFSNYGEWVDVAAPGGNIYSTTPLSLFGGSGYASLSGTSVASPHVAGLAALVFTKVTDKNGNGFLNDEVFDCIVKNTDNIGVSGIGGRINAYKAVQCGSTTPSDTSPPTASISSPLAGQTVSGGINVNVSASDNVGVSKVDLYLDGVLFASDITSPYSFFWDTTKTANGSHTLFARAYDSAGNSGLSNNISVSVNNTSTTDPFAPSVSISSPVNGAVVSRNSTVTITATALDNVGVTRVEFYVNGSLKCTDTSASYTCVWKVSGKRRTTYTLTAKAYDAAGNIGTSAAVQVISN